MIINEEYFLWLCEKVEPKGFKRNLYSKLFHHLHNRNFTWYSDIPNDKNRYEDGIDLRFRFGYEMQYDDQIIEEELNICECSVLEMIIALAMRCEDEIMYDSNYGNRYERWFWLMITNMGLNQMDDAHYDADYVDERINVMIYRDYNSDGSDGGLFVVDCEYDLRYVEIWYQCMWYLTRSDGGRI